MQRSTIRGFLSFTNTTFLRAKPIVALECRSLPSLNISKRCSYGKPMNRAGSMTFLLDIIGRLDIFLPSVAVIYVTSLRKCIRSRKYQMGQVAHSHIIKLGFVSELLVSNILLDMYAKAGLVDCSAKVFDEMAHGDQFSWCGLISGHVRHGFDLEAYGLFRRMIEMGHKPKHFVLSSVLRACSASGILELGVLVHSFALKSGLDFDRFVEVGLVSMYAKCGALDDALKVFYGIPIKNSISWNTIISGCIQNWHLMKAVEMCREMCQAGFIMDLVTLRVVMSAGSALQGLDFCKSIHVYSIKVGLDIDCFIVAELVKLLVRLGNVPYMTQLFNIVKRPDASLYTLVISGYHAHGFRAEAVKLAKELLCLGMELKEGSVISIFNLCLSKEEGTEVHARILKAGHLSYVSVGNALISMYIRNGELEEAYEIFLEMPERDAVSWTAIMAGLANEHHFKEALKTFQALRKTEMQVDQHTVTVAISVCTSLREIDKGRQIHALSLKNGLEYFNITRASFINMYAKYGQINCAARLFSYSLSKGDLILTNVMLSGYCSNFQQLKAFELFRTEYHSGLIPDQFSLSIILGACADMKTLKIGVQIHSLVVKCGFEFSDIVTGNALINMYIKSEDIPSACKFYYSFRGKSNILREMLMAGHIRYTGRNEAINVFWLLQRSCFHGNPVAFARVLRGCEDFAPINSEKRMHASIMNVGIVSDASQINNPLGLIDKPCLLDRAVEDTHVLPRGGNATCDSNVFRTQEDEDEDKICFLGCSKEERKSADLYDNGVDFYAVALSGAREASSTIKVDFQEASEVPRYTKFSTISNRLSAVSVS